MAFALTLVALLVASVWLRVTSDPGAPPEGDPTALAADACGHLFGRFAEQIRGDAPAAAVLDGLREAERDARDAAELDPAWRALAGAVGAVREAIELDDPGAARIGMRVATTECGRTEVTG
ncbi:MAG: hypothetical protein ACLGIR_04335 [Actinomycetes bacterium]